MSLMMDVMLCTCRGGAAIVAQSCALCFAPSMRDGLGIVRLSINAFFGAAVVAVPLLLSSPKIVRPTPDEGVRYVA